MTGPWPLLALCDLDLFLEGKGQFGFIGCCLGNRSRFCVSGKKKKFKYHNSGAVSSVPAVRGHRVSLSTIRGHVSSICPPLVQLGLGLAKNVGRICLELLQSHVENTSSFGKGSRSGSNERAPLSRTRVSSLGLPQPGQV